MTFTFPHDRGFILGVILTALVPAFAVVHIAVARYKDERQRLAAEWTSRGERDAAADPAAAVTDFETALAYGAGESTELALARALAAAGRPNEAQAHLLTLWVDQPGSGDINLQLARIAAAAGELQDAIRYYHAAVDGAWEGHAPEARRGARLELARLLLSAGQDLRAQAELIALIDDLPPDPALIVDTGKLLADAGANSRALALFQRALELQPGNAAAARLAGAAEFREGNDPLAREYLTRAAAGGPLDADSAAMLDVSRRTLSLDPTAAPDVRQRAARVLEMLNVARARLQRCRRGSADSESDQIAGLARQLDAAEKIRPRALARDRDKADQIAALAFDIERLPLASCGPDSVDDRAIQRIAARAPAPGSARSSKAR